MIRNIYIHAGLHKTGSTTIQFALYNLKQKLYDLGFLYPDIKINNKSVNNHAHQLKSLFAENPQNIPDNLSLGYTNEEILNRVHENYRNQLEEQIHIFNGENIIFSGEHISQLSENGLLRLVSYLQRITQEDVTLCVIIFVRHPISRSISGAQQVIKSGLTIEEASNRALFKAKRYFREKLQKFIYVFGKEHVKIVRFEDAIKHEQGLVSCFLNAIGVKDEKVYFPRIIIRNKTVSYEGLILIDAINRKMPRPGYGLKTDDHKYVALPLIKKMPGSKFDFSVELKEKIWGHSCEDMRWLCDTFNLPLYEYKSQNNQSIFNIWRIKSLFFLYKILLFQDVRSRNIVMLAFKSEIRRYNDHLPYKNRLLLKSNYTILNCYSMLLRSLDGLKIKLKHYLS